jgi:hypothetical protein
MNPWIPYAGTYEKQVYDIKLKSGTIIVCCWPNAGRFTELHAGTAYDGELVEAFRPSEHNDF